MNNYDEIALAEQARIALWHEAGHAAVAHFLGLKVVSIGIYPIPHCLVDHSGVSDDEYALLLCAGAAAAKQYCGWEWGCHNDYELASTLGDLEVYKARADEFVRKHASEIQHIVDTLDPEGKHLDNTRFPELGHADPVAISIELLLEESAPSAKLAKSIALVAAWQTRFPKAASSLHRLVARAKGALKGVAA